MNINFAQIAQLQRASGCDFYLQQYDDKLIFYPVHKKLISFLKITEKYIEKLTKFPFGTKVKTKTIQAYIEIDTDAGPVGLTYQGFTGNLVSIIVSLGCTFHLVDSRIASVFNKTFPPPRLDLMHGFRFSQKELLTEALLKDSSGLIGAPTRYGKCLGAGTMVRMEDGSLKAIQDIKVGDKLKSPAYKRESQSVVLNTCMGVCNKMYRVSYKPTAAERLIFGLDTFSFICTSDHLIAFYDEDKQILHYVQAQNIKHTASRPVLQVADNIKSCNAATNTCLPVNLIVEGSKIHLNPKYALRGLVLKNQITCEPCNETTYYGFQTTEQEGLFLININDGPYDIVTHNTTLITNTIRAYPNLSVCLTAPGIDLVKQLYNDLTGERGLSGNRDVRLICTGTKKIQAAQGGVTVCSVDSLDAIDKNSIDLLLVDEPHALVTDKRLTAIDSFTKARRLGFGATLHGRFDGRDKLIVGAFGPVLADKSYDEAVKEGAICPISIIFLNIEITPDFCRDRNIAYNKFLFKNKGITLLASKICNEVIPQDFQTLIFVKHEKQADLLMGQMPAGTTLAMAKRMTKAEREQCDMLMKSNKIKRCICTKIYVQGVTFSDVRVLINLEAGGNNTSAIQKPGRLAEIRPGKKCGIVIDLMFKPPYDDWQTYSDAAWLALCRESIARQEAYTEKGYDIHFVNNLSELATKFNELI